MLIIDEIINPKLLGKSFNIKTNVDDAIAVTIIGLDFLKRYYYTNESG